MNVGELKALLSNAPDNLPIYIQIDPEGNGFHKAQGAEEGMFEGDTNRPDDIHPPEAAEQPQRYEVENYERNCMVIFP